MHKPPILKRLTCREGDTQFLTIYHFLVNSIYYPNNSKRNKDYLNRYIKDDLKKLNKETQYSGKLSFCIFDLNQLVLDSSVS